MPAGTAKARSSPGLSFQGKTNMDTLLSYGSLWAIGARTCVNRLSPGKTSAATQEEVGPSLTQV